MKFKVHWIIDGIAEIEGESKEDAEKKLQESLEDYVKNSEDLMNKFIAKSIQGTAYLEGEKDKEKHDFKVSAPSFSTIVFFKGTKRSFKHFSIFTFFNPFLEYLLSL